MSGAVSCLDVTSKVDREMQMMTAPTPEGAPMPMMAMVAMVVRSESPIVGWLYHLLNSAVIGAAVPRHVRLRAAADAADAPSRHGEPGWPPSLRAHPWPRLRSCLFGIAGARGFGGVPRVTDRRLCSPCAPTHGAYDRSR